MARYVDADNLLEEIKSLSVFLGGDNVFNKTAKESVLRVIDEQPTADVVGIPQNGIGDLSDGYHTFNELYHHRAVLFSVICNMFPDKAWKSKLHDTGDMFDGMFIVGIEAPKGQATYHYDINPYWELFKVKELDRAPKWDGHTPQDAINRIAELSNVAEVKHGEWNIGEFNKIRQIVVVECSECNCVIELPMPTYGLIYNYCPNCGAKMDGGKAE